MYERKFVCRKSFKFFICISILTLLTLLFPYKAFAYPNHAANSQSQIQQLDSKIERQMLEINKINADIAKTQRDILNKNAKIKQTETKISKEQELFDERVRVMYISGSSTTETYLTVLLSADSFEDFLGKVEVIKKIISYDTSLITNMNEEKQQLQIEKKALDTKNKEMIALKGTSEKKLADLREAKKKAVALSKIQAVPQENSAEIQAVLKSITNYKNISPSRGKNLKSGINIVASASNYLGTPYVWGGASPSGFDCSGFTRYIYAKAGVSLTRTAAEQQMQGYAVSRSELLPGDLVFFGLPAHHVGIYVGNGCFIHAPHTGDVVKVSSLSSLSDFSIGKRILN